MDLRGRKLVCDIYWRRVKHVDSSTVTYDSFVTREDGAIVQIGKDLKEELSVILQEIKDGHLQIE